MIDIESHTKKRKKLETPPKNHASLSTIAWNKKHYGRTNGKDI